MQVQVLNNSKLLVGYDDKFLLIILSIRLSMAFSLSHVFIKNVTKNVEGLRKKKLEKIFYDFKFKFRYPNNRISNPLLYKKTQTRNFKINRFQIRAF